MIIVHVLASALLALSGINDTGKFLEETVKTFKMIEKPSNSKNSDAIDDKKNFEQNVAEDKRSNAEIYKPATSEVKSENAISEGTSESANLTENSCTSNSSDNVKNDESTSVSKKINSLSDKYNKHVVSPLRFPSQIQKNLVAFIKPVAEFFSAGYIALGHKAKGTPFKWFDTLSGKPNDELLGLQ